MNADQLLRQMFVEHEHLAPDADETLRQVHDQVGERTAVNRGGSRRRPFVLAATGVGVAATVVGIIAASVIIKANDKPVGPTAPATHSTGPSPSSVTSTSGHARPITVAGLDSLTVAAGYLPPGQATQVYAGNGILGEQLKYVVTDGPTSTKVDLTSAASAVVLQGTNTFTGPGTSVQVGGDAAHQWATTGRGRVVITRPGGVTAVDVSRTAMASAAIAALTRQVAGQLRYPNHDAIKPEFRLGYVPSGLRVGQLGVDNHGATTWLLTATAPSGSAPLGSNTQVYSTIAPPVLRGPTNRTVQGHPTQTGTEDGVPVLEIFNAAGRHTIVISGGPWAMSLSELYKMGDALVLPS